MKITNILKQNARSLLILGVIFVLAIASSAFLGSDSLKSSLMALALVVLSGIISMVPVIRSVYLTSVISSACAIFSIVIRLVIMLFGSICILFLTQISVLYFVLWLAVFYLPMITVEVLIILSLINTGKQI